MAVAVHTAQKRPKTATGAKKAESASKAARKRFGEDGRVADDRPGDAAPPVRTALFAEMEAVVGPDPPPPQPANEAPAPAPGPAPTDELAKPDAVDQTEVQVETPEPAPPADEVEPPTAQSGSRAVIGSLVTASASAFVSVLQGAGRLMSAAVTREEDQARDEMPAFAAVLPGPEQAEAQPGPAAPVVQQRVDEGAEGPDATAPVVVPETIVPVERVRVGDAFDVVLQAVERLFDRQQRFLRAVARVSSRTSVNTDPGAPPRANLSGRSDPARGTNQARDADEKLVGGHTQWRRNLEDSPGAEQVQRQPVDQSYALEPQVVEAVPAPEVDPELAYYSNLPIAADVRGQADRLLAPSLETALEQPGEQLRGDVQAREDQRTQAVSDAQGQVDTANRDAAQRQDREVDSARAEIETARDDARAKQDRELEGARRKSHKARDDAQRKIHDRRSRDEGRIEREYADAQRRADAKKRETEAKAGRKKRDAEEKQKSESWWERIGDAVSSFLNSLADAIGAMFEALAKAVAGIIEAAKKFATGLIDALVRFATSILDALGDVLTGLVQGLLGDIFPELARALTKLIDAAVDAAKTAAQKVGDELKEGVAALADTVNSTIQAGINALKTAVTTGLRVAGAVARGDLAGAFREVLRGALELAGIDPEAFFAVVSQARDTLKLIVDFPLRFIRNLISAVSKGFGQFGDNFLQHLKTGFFEWIVGPLGELGISLPEKWDLQGVFGLVLEVLGLTRDGIRDIIVELAGERGGQIFDFVMRYVDALIQGGLSGLWEQVKSDLSNLWSMVVDGIKNWLMQTIVVQAAIKVVALFTPVGAILEVVRTAWSVYTFLRDKIQQIWGVVQAVVEGITQIAKGVWAPVANLVEQQLARLIPIAISLLAKLLRVDGITEKVSEIIERIRTTVREAIKSLILRVIRLFKGGAEEEDEASEEEGEFDGEIGETLTWSVDQERHRLWISVEGGKATIMVASEESPVPEALEWYEALANDLINNRQKKLGDRIVKKVARARKLHESLDERSDELAAALAAERADEDTDETDSEIERDLKRLRVLIEKIQELLGIKEDEEKKRALAEFGRRLFTARELADVLGLARGDGRATEWIDEGFLFRLASAKTDPRTEYSFDPVLAGQRGTNPNNRSKYGYVNPKKNSSKGRQILTKGLNRKKSKPKIRTTDQTFHEKRARYNSKAKITKFKGDKTFRYKDAILGHGKLGASDHWHQFGHKQERSKNTTWNQKVSTYHGPEERKESSATGAGSKPYRVPSKAIGSHESWWKNPS